MVARVGVALTRDHRTTKGFIYRLCRVVSDFITLPFSNLRDVCNLRVSALCSALSPSMNEEKCRECKLAYADVQTKCKCIYVPF